LSTSDIIIIGAGMAGVSAAWDMAADCRVTVLEAEPQAGYHSTGRSAAAYIPSYGYQNDALRRLTAASLSFFRRPPFEHLENELLTPRDLLTIAAGSEVPALQAEYAKLQSVFPAIEWLGPEALAASVPCLVEEYRHGGCFESGVFDIDVHALHDAYLRAFRARGGELYTDSSVEHIDHRAGLWRVSTRGDVYQAPVLVNAAGAWAGKVAELAGVPGIGLRPLRRTACLLRPPEGVELDDWPLLMDHAGKFYFKPDAGLLLASPADETLSVPCDAQPEELDIAYAAHFAESVLGFTVRTVPHAWAGLRSFVADRAPVIGFADDPRGFFWLAGQGGHGIQTAPAIARLAGHLVRGEAPDGELAASGFDVATVSPIRAALRSTDDDYQQNDHQLKEKVS
tara:strand:- start:28541 stop:29731 length:1191 start_codon:yes stop_codon:yes gene_type:complete